MQGFTLTKRFLKENQKGFTLIELLVVISIIAVLAALGAISYSTAQVRARDSQRKSDLQQLRGAMESYFTNNNQYPSVATYNSIPVGSTWTAGSSVYMRKMPGDPTTNAKYLYSAYADSGLTVSCSSICVGYKITSCIENGNDSQKDAPKNISCSTPASYTVSSP